MKLKNKKTGEIRNAVDIDMYTDSVYLKVSDGEFDNETIEYHSLAELNEEWEDYEEPKEFYYIEPNGVISRIDGWECYTEADNEIMKTLGNYFETKEEAEKAVEKLKAWKRLKDKDFQFHGHNALGLGEITFSLDFEDMDDEGKIGQLRHDLDLLFSGEDD